MKNIPTTLAASLSLMTLLLIVATAAPTAYGDGGAVDTMSLTDEPGNWFKVISQERRSQRSAPVNGSILILITAARVLDTRLRSS